MFLTKTITRKLLEKLIQETFSTFGSLSCSYLVDSLKFLGFCYSTHSGLSISIEDLKTPLEKKFVLKKAKEEVSSVSENWKKGFLSDAERFQQIISIWDEATESLKDRIVEYYQKFDPLNSLYIMAFSGARGNMAQVRQLVGMRGLMSDKDGKIIDLPIQKSFREGLNSIDYIISSYGARKGVVDTALKTADAGYLTRRLIYLTQELSIKEVDCETKEGVSIFVHSESNLANIVGRKIVSVSSTVFPYTKISFLSNKFFKNIEDYNLTFFSPFHIVFRSPLTCQAKNAICQTCYGWDLSTRQLISLGQNVGILAAQSIGEPGTQLTMRTFHTGGIYTSSKKEQFFSSFSGKLSLSDYECVEKIRTVQGKNLLRTKTDLKILIVNWKGQKENSLIKAGSNLVVSNQTFLAKGSLIAEYGYLEKIGKLKKYKPIFSFLDGEIVLENYSKNNKDNHKILWILSSSLFSSPKESFFLEKKKFTQKNSSNYVSIFAPESGIIFLNYSLLTLITKNKKLEINLKEYFFAQNNLSLEICPLIKNYSYVDSFTTLVLFYFLPKVKGDIYTKITYLGEKLEKKKEVEKNSNFFSFLTSRNIWKYYSEQINYFSKFQTNQRFLRRQEILNTSFSILSSSVFWKQNGVAFSFQHALPIYNDKATCLKVKAGNWLRKGDIIAFLPYYTQQTQDIVQGLPKIEQLLEVRLGKTRSILVSEPGCSLGFYVSIQNERQENNLVKKTKDQIPLEIFYSQGYKLPQSSNSDQIILLDNLLTYNFISGVQNDKFPDLLIDLKLEKEQKKNIYFPQFSTNKYCLVKRIILKQYTKEVHYQFVFPKGKFANIGEKLTTGSIDYNQLIFYFFSQYQKFTTSLYASKLSTFKIQIILINAIQSIYHSQGVFLSSKHIEIVIKQMTSKIKISASHNFQLPFVNGDLVPFSFFKEVYYVYEKIYGKTALKQSEYYPDPILALNQETHEYYEKQTKKYEEGKTMKAAKPRPSIMFPSFRPVIRPMTQVSLERNGFLAAAGFQGTRKVLTKAAIQGKKDWFKGLKESVIAGKLVPGGSSFLTSKQYLDSIYFFLR
jgi:hypothetical protein